MNLDYNTEFQVKARNDLNLIKTYLQAKYIPIFSAQIGKSIFNKDCSFNKRFLNTIDLEIDKEEIKKIIEPYKNGHISVRLLLKSDSGDVYFWFDICYSGGSYEDKTYFCSYNQDYLYIADKENNEISKIYTPKVFELYDLKVVNDSIAKIKDLEIEINSLNKNIPYGVKY